MAKQSSDKPNGGSKEIVQRSVQVELDLWNEARRKAIGHGSLSEIIRRLLKLWTEGKINLEDFED